MRSPVACSYDPAVPEGRAGLPAIPNLPWASLSHRQILAELAGAGGRLRGGAALPEGALVARVCPFDPAYWAFVDLCHECAGNR